MHIREEMLIHTHTNRMVCKHVSGVVSSADFQDIPL